MGIYFPGVLGFFVLVGFLGLILHCCSLTNDPRVAGCQNCCYGWGILDCFPASMEACFVLVIVCVVIFAILGIAYGFLAATMAIQRIWQRHYHILTKKELTQVIGHLLSRKAYIFWWYNNISKQLSWSLSHPKLVLVRLFTLGCVNSAEFDWTFDAMLCFKQYNYHFQQSVYYFLIVYWLHRKENLVSWWFQWCINYHLRSVWSHVCSFCSFSTSINN